MTDLEQLAPNELTRRYNRGGAAVLADDTLSPEQKMWALRALEYIYQTWHNQLSAAQGLENKEDAVILDNQRRALADIRAHIAKLDPTAEPNVHGSTELRRPDGTPWPEVFQSRRRRMRRANMVTLGFAAAVLVVLVVSLLGGG